jgi:type III pantothenate kinase
MTVLALDAGNSHVKAARWDGAAWSDVLRWPTAAPVPDALAVLAHGVDAAGIASVVPAHTDRLARALAALTGRAPTLVSAALPLPFAMAYRTPATLGADRIAAAVAAWHGWGGERPVVALDAGTAVTLDVVGLGADGPVFLGGAIAPGPDLLRRSLVRDTGQLPDVPFAWPDAVVGGSTAEAIQAGLTVLFADGVAGLLARTADALGAPPVVVATGGWAPWLAERVGGIDVVAPMLVLDGVRALTVGAR